VSETEAEVTPALFDHAVRVFEEMQNRSRTEEVDNADDPSGYVQVKVYEGHLTRLFADLQIANPYYTKIRNALVGQNCIEQLRRGGGSAMSKWIVRHPPDEETFRAILERRHGAPKGKNQVLEQRVRDLTRQVNDYGQRIDDLQLLAEQLQERIIKLEES
jgi:hypothetical protein